MANPAHYPVEIKVPTGPITVDGTRRNARMLIEYLEGWLHGRGAKGMDSLAGKSGVHPGLSVIVFSLVQDKIQAPLSLNMPRISDFFDGCSLLPSHEMTMV
jgi:hypothetical protein